MLSATQKSKQHLFNPHSLTQYSLPSFLKYWVPVSHCVLWQRLCSVSWDLAQLPRPCSGLTSSLKASRIPPGHSHIWHLIVVITHLESHNCSKITCLLFRISFCILSPTVTTGSRSSVTVAYELYFFHKADYRTVLISEYSTFLLISFNIFRALLAAGGHIKRFICLGKQLAVS